jgi:hypothetical protein
MQTQNAQQVATLAAQLVNVANDLFAALKVAHNTASTQTQRSLHEMEEWVNVISANADDLQLSACALREGSEYTLSVYVVSMRGGGDDEDAWEVVCVCETEHAAKQYIAKQLHPQYYNYAEREVIE